MRPKRMKWLGTSIVVMVLMIAGNFAVATSLYDGTIGDADPVSQGQLNLTLTGTASATPDPVPTAPISTIGCGAGQVPEALVV